MDNKLAVVDVEKVANAMVKSGFFADVKDASQAMVKIMAGQEMGFGAFASMSGIYIIQGKPSVGANLMAAAVKGSGKYDYKVTVMNDKECTIIFTQSGKDIGTSTFTLEDAKKVQTKNMDKFPRNMLFARAMSNGVRWFTPDIFLGAPVYTPDELGAEVNQDGEVIEVPYIPQPTNHILAEVAEMGGVVTTMDIETAASVVSSKGEKYGDLDSDLLVNMANSIQKVLAKNGMTVEERDEKLYKLDAIRTILASRNEAK
jgi:hypothetical protein